MLRQNGCGGRVAKSVDRGTSKRGRFESVIGKDTGEKGRGTILVQKGVGWGGRGEAAGGRGTFLVCRSASVFCKAVVSEGGIWMWEVGWDK